MKKVLIIIFFGLFFAPLQTFAAVGDNCSLDITGAVPDSVDWRTVYTLEGEDGSAWRRAIVKIPDDILRLSEGSLSQISATTLPNAETQVFIFGADDPNTYIGKPGNGVCFEGPQANAEGNVVFPVSNRFLWNSIDQQIVVDVFYRLSGNWNQLNRPQAVNVYRFGTGLPPKVIDVLLDTDVQDEAERQGRVESVGQTFTQGTATDLNTFNANVGPLSISGELVQTAKNQKTPVCLALCDEGVHLGVHLNPAFLPPQFQAGLFDAVEGQAVTIGRLPGPHTLSAGVEGGQNFQQKTLQPIVHTAVYFELLKRALLGNEHASGEMPGLSEFSASELLEAAGREGDYSEHTRQLAQNIKYLLVHPQLRAPAAKFIADSIKQADADLMKNETFGLELAARLLQAIPETASSPSSWAEDFVTLTEFWTGRTAENICLLLNDNKIGSVLTVNFSPEASPKRCGLSYFSGETPLILLNTLEPVMLSPVFHDTKIVYAEQAFSAGNGWALPAGKKLPLAYRYDFTAPFTRLRQGEMCVQKSRLPVLLSAIEDKYRLSTQETFALARELTAEFPQTTDFVHLSLAHPADIASRFSWNGNGKPLSLLQLFFEFTPGGCSNESIAAPIIKLPAKRDGFEVGILR